MLNINSLTEKQTEQFVDTFLSKTRLVNCERKFKGPVNAMYSKGLNFLKEGDNENAQHCFELCLIMLTEHTEKRHEFVEGERLDLWKDRVWLKMEENDIVDNSPLWMMNVEEDEVDINDNW